MTVDRACPISIVREPFDRSPFLPYINSHVYSHSNKRNGYGNWPTDVSFVPANEDR